MGLLESREVECLWKRVPAASRAAGAAASGTSLALEPGHRGAIS